MKILGISAFYHDSAAAVTLDGQIAAAAQEERFSRKKHDPAFPENAVRYCLRETGLTLDQLDAVAFYDKPLLKFERLLETYYAFAPRGLRSFLAGMPVWLNEKMFLKRLLLKELEKIEPFDRRRLLLLFPEHHLSHAASAFYPSPFSEAAILTLDGVGEWATASIGLGRGREIRVLKELRFPHSPGLLYSAFTYFLGFRVNSGEYKLMGLAPYGNPDGPETARFLETIRTELADLRPDGSLWLHQKHFDYAIGLRMAKDKNWERLFGFPRRRPDAPLETCHCNLALAIQIFTEEIVLAMAAEARRLTGAKNLCLAGGVALNCTANGKLRERGIFEDIFVQPAAGDAGGAPGAALAAHHIYYGVERPPPAPGETDGMSGALLGPSFEDSDVREVCRKHGAPARHFENFGALAAEVARRLDEGQIVGWVQSRMEFGPRALGNRSILGDPRNAEMQQKLNLKIKFRESFRPFAPAVQAERAGEYFSNAGASPYMLFVDSVRPEHRRPLPPDFAARPLREKLGYLRSDLPAVTHVDFSARVQTVERKTNPRFWGLLEAFRQRTGCAVLVNTSFNVRGEPIVCSPEDAYRCFMRTGMDALVVGDFLFEKTGQPAFAATDDWQKTFQLD